MEVSRAMSSHVKIASPNQSIKDAARVMAAIDAGVLPVAQNGRLEGMITDRDIAVRAVALGMDPGTPVREIMTEEVRYCFEDDELDDVAREMAELKVRRMPVLNHQERLVGILSLGDIALATAADSAGNALCGISEPGGDHCQSADRRGSRALMES
jgi:CBS domain-containing protein